MAKGGYVWGRGALPLVEDHSRAKHDVLRAYLVNYLRILAQSPHSRGIEVALVDGFAGGGEYRTPNGVVVSGSPLVLLEAIREARALVPEDRKRRGFQGAYEIRVHVHLVETRRDAHEHLKKLIAERTDPKDATTIVHVHHGRFEQLLPTIIGDIHRRQRRTGRSVFILDQYGWSQVPLELVQRIFSELPRAEVFLTWMIDALINFLSEKMLDKLTPGLEKSGLSPYVTTEQLVAVKEDPANATVWRRVIQTLLTNEIRTIAGAAYSTPFYIVPATSHRGYWLLHLAQHLRANEEMKRIHWSNNNLQHPGGPGLNMLGYVGTGGQLAFDNRFDDSANLLTLQTLADDIPRRLRDANGPMRFGALVEGTANETPAKRAQMAAAVFGLSQRKQLRITTVAGSTRRGAEGLDDADVVEIPAQTWFFLS